MLEKFKVYFNLHGFIIIDAKTDKEARKNTNLFVEEQKNNLEQELKCVVTNEKYVTDVIMNDNGDDFDAHFSINGYILVDSENKEKSRVTIDELFKNKINEIESIFGTGLADEKYVTKIIPQ